MLQPSLLNKVIVGQQVDGGASARNALSSGNAVGGFLNILFG